MDIDYHLSRWADLDKDRANHESDWEELAVYIMPGTIGHSIDREPGDRTDQDEVYDQTAVRANIKLASSMHGALTGPSAKWFSLRFRDKEISQDDKAREWLEACGEAMFAALAESNFNSRINESYLDLSCYGVTNLWCTMGREGKLVFDTFHLSECAIAEGEDGRVDTLYRRFELSARNALNRWPDGELPSARKYVEDGDPDRKLAFVTVVEPNADYNPGAKLKETARPIYSCVICVTDQEKVSETGYWTQPFVAPRWSKRTGDPYGWGPGSAAINDIKTLNAAKATELDAWEKSIDPPMKALDQAVAGDVDLVAGGVTVVSDMNGIQPLVNATNWNATMIKGQELQQSIKEAFYDRMLDFPGGPNVTATEIVRRTEMMQRELAPVLGRLQSELLSPLVERVFDVMNRNGMLPAPPESVVNAAGSNVDIEYVSPLARAQKAGDIESIERWVGTLSQVAQINPGVLDRVDWDKLPQVLAERMGTPSEVIASDQQVEEARAQRAQAMQRQMAMQQEGAGGQVQ